MGGCGIVLGTRAAAKLATAQLAASHRRGQVYGLAVVEEGRVERVVLPRNAAAGGFDRWALREALRRLELEGVGDRRLAVVRAAPTATTGLTRLDLAVAQMLAPEGCPRLFVLRGALRATLALATTAAGRRLSFAAPLPTVDDGEAPPTAADRRAWREEALRAMSAEDETEPERDPAALFDRCDPDELRERSVAGRWVSAP